MAGPILRQPVLGVLSPNRRDKGCEVVTAAAAEVSSGSPMSRFFLLTSKNFLVGFRLRVSDLVVQFDST